MEKTTLLYFLGTYSFALYSKINYWFCVWSYYDNEILNNHVNHFMRNHPHWNINDKKKPWKIFYGLCFWIHLHPMVQSTLQSKWGISQEIKCFVILLANSCKIIQIDLTNDRRDVMKNTLSPLKRFVLWCILHTIHFTIILLVNFPLRNSMINLKFNIVKIEYRIIALCSVKYSIMRHIIHQTT